MHTRGLWKKLAKEKEMEENRGEEEEGTPIEEVETAITTTEPTQDEEMELQAGDKGEVRGDPNILKLMEMMNNNLKEMNKKFDKNEESLKESLKQMKKETSENFKKQEDNFQKQKEELRQTINKNNEILQQRLMEEIQQRNEELKKELKEQLKKDHEKNKEEMKQQIRLIFKGCREESNQTKTEMNKKWEETRYPANQLDETVDSGFIQLNEKLDNASDGINEEIQNKEDKDVLFSGNKDNKNNEKIKHIKTNRRRVKKNQIIKKIKKTKEIGKIYKKKLLKTREEVEMMNGLIDVFNLPLTDQRKLMRYKDCRRTLKEIIEGIHNQPAEENFSKSIRKWKLHKIDRTHNKIGCHKLRRYLTCLLYTSIVKKQCTGILYFTKL